MISLQTQRVAIAHLEIHFMEFYESNPTVVNFDIYGFFSLNTVALSIVPLQSQWGA